MDRFVLWNLNYKCPSHKNLEYVGVTSTCRTKFRTLGAAHCVHLHKLVSNHCKIFLETHSNNASTPPTTSTTTTTNPTTQHKNKIKHLFEIANLGFLNFNRWFQRSWLLLDLISVRLMLLDVILVRLAADDGLRCCSTVLAISERFGWVRDFGEPRWDWQG